MSNKLPRGDRRSLSWLLAQTVERGECREWKWGHHSQGYGRLHIGAETILVHRLVCELAHGAPFAQAQAIHSCDNYPCVNPDHLSWGTQRRNQDEAVTRERFARKLNWAAVRDIRERLAAGETQRSVARLHRVSQANVGYIANNQIWPLGLDPDRKDKA